MKEETVPEDNTDSFVESVVSAGSTDDLDALLNEWGERTVEESDPILHSLSENPANGQVVQVNPDPLSALQQEVQELKQARIADMDAQDAAAAVTKVKETIGRDDIDTQMVGDLLDAQMRRDPYMTRACELRHAHPEQWQQVLDSAAKRIGEALPETYVDDRAERESAAAFAHGYVTGKEVPKPEVTNDDLAKMSDKDFNEYQKSIGLAP